MIISKCTQYVEWITLINFQPKHPQHCKSNQNTPNIANLNNLPCFNSSNVF